MAGSVIVISNESPADVYGSHGGSSVVHWKRLAVTGFVDGVMDSFDYNRVGPGSVIGLHTHRVTEEIYVILSGSAEVFSTTDKRRVGPGDVALLGRYGSHGIVNDTNEDMEFLVVEAQPPSVLRALYEGDATTPDPDRSALAVAHVEEASPLDLGTMLNAPWGEVKITTLQPGESMNVKSDEWEYAMYLVSGTARLSIKEGERDLNAGTGIVFTRWTEGTITAADEPARLVSISTGTDSIRLEQHVKVDAASR